MRPALKATEIEIALNKTLVASAEEALTLGFVSSPTIRVYGCAIAGELRESACGECGDSCGCGADTGCRVWVYEGQEHTAAPVGVIVDAILGAIHAPASPESPQYQTLAILPANLQRFYAAKAPAA